MTEEINGEPRCLHGPVFGDGDRWRCLKCRAEFVLRTVLEEERKTTDRTFKAFEQQNADVTILRKAMEDILTARHLNEAYGFAKDALLITDHHRGGGR